MRLSDFRAHLLTYHVERGDPQGKLLSHELRRRADQQLEGEQVGSPQSAQLKRSQELFKALQSQHPLWIHSLQGMSATPRHLGLMITLGGFFVGWGGQALGADARFHLLSPVLLTLILWNCMSLALMLFVSVRARPEAHEHDENHGSVPFKPHTTQLDRLAQLQGQLKDHFEGLHEHLQQELTSGHEGRRRELGVWGAVVSGLISGLGADLMAGGLTLGGGMIAGGIAGLLTGMGAAELHSHLTHEGKVTRWDRAFIEREYLSMLSMTLIASSFGRAQGQLSIGYDQVSVEAQLSKLIEDQRLQGQIDLLYRSLEEDTQCVALIEELLTDLL